MDDLLSQWRGYSYRGGGYSLGIDPFAVNLHNPSIDFLRVLYDPQKQNVLLSSIVEEATKTIHAICGLVPDLATSEPHLPSWDVWLRGRGFSGPELGVDQNLFVN